MDKAEKTTDTRTNAQSAELTPAKTYKVWIEIEEYDNETEEGVTVDGALGISSTAEFATLDWAINFAERLHYTGEQLATEYTEVDDV